MELIRTRTQGLYPVNVTCGAMFRVLELSGIQTGKPKPEGLEASN